MEKVSEEILAEGTELRKSQSGIQAELGSLEITKHEIEKRTAFLKAEFDKSAEQGNALMARVSEEYGSVTGVNWETGEYTLKVSE